MGSKIEFNWALKLSPENGLNESILRDITGLEKYKLVIDKNDDTMIDLILGTAGTIIFVIGKTITNLFNKKSKKKK